MAPGTGITVAMAGRATPLTRPMRRRALAIAAPVLPALTIADARPSRTASAARTTDESFLRRTPPAGSSCMSTTSLASSTSMPHVLPMASRRPTRRMGTPSSSAAWRAPATISRGPLSAPITSTAMGSRTGVGRDGSMPWEGLSGLVIPGAGSGGLVDVDGLTPAVPAAVGADDVGCLDLAALGAGALGRRGQAPVRRPATAALGL